MNILLPPLLPPSTHTINFCTKHPSQRVVGVCGSCLKDKLSSLASAYSNFYSVSPASASPEVLYKDSVHKSSGLEKQSSFDQEIKSAEEPGINFVKQVVNQEIKEVISVNDSAEEQGNTLSESEDGSSGLQVNEEIIDDQESNRVYDMSDGGDGSSNRTVSEKISVKDEVQEKRDCRVTEEIEADDRDREAISEGDGEQRITERGDNELCITEEIEEEKADISNNRTEKLCITEEPEEGAGDNNDRSRAEIDHGYGKESVEECVVVAEEGASVQKVTLKNLFDMEDEHYSKTQKIIEAGDTTPVGNSCRCVCVNGNGGDVSKYSVIFDSLLCRSRKRVEVREEEVIRRIIKEAEVIKRNAELIKRDADAINKRDAEVVKRKADVIKKDAEVISDEISKVVSDPGVISNDACLIQDGIKRRIIRSISGRQVMKGNDEVISRAISDTQVIKDSAKDTSGDLTENRGSFGENDREIRRRIRKQQLARRIKEEVHVTRVPVPVATAVATEEGRVADAWTRAQEQELAASTATLDFEGRQLPVIYGRSLSWSASWAEKAAQQAARRQQVLPEYKAWEPYCGSPGFKRSASGGHYKKGMAASSRGAGVGGARAPVSAAVAGAPPFFLKFYMPPLVRSRSKAAVCSRSGVPKRRRFWSLFLFS